MVEKHTGRGRRLHALLTGSITASNEHHTWECVMQLTSSMAVFSFPLHTQQTYPLPKPDFLSRNWTYTWGAIEGEPFAQLSQSQHSTAQLSTAQHTTQYAVLVLFVCFFNLVCASLNDILFLFFCTARWALVYTRGSCLVIKSLLLPLLFITIITKDMNILYITKAEFKALPSIVGGGGGGGGFMQEIWEKFLWIIPCLCKLFFLFLSFFFYLEISCFLFFLPGDQLAYTNFTLLRQGSVHSSSVNSSAVNVAESHKLFSLTMITRGLCCKDIQAHHRKSDLFVSHWNCLKGKLGKAWDGLGHAQTFWTLRLCR